MYIRIRIVLDAPRAIGLASDRMTRNPVRRKIEQRRARFVAASLAGCVSLQSGCGVRQVTTAEQPHNPPVAASDPIDAQPPPGAALADMDRDGVLDEEDQCPVDPGQPKPWGRHGCPGPCLTIVEPSVIRIEATIMFDTGSDRLRGETEAILDEIAFAMADHRTMGLVVQGHRDVGEAPALGSKRAESVRDALVSRGVDASRVRVEDHGDEDARPAYPNRAVRFRVEER